MLVLHLVCGVSKTHSNYVASVEYLLDGYHNQCLGLLLREVVGNYCGANSDLRHDLGFFVTYHTYYNPFMVKDGAFC